MKLSDLKNAEVLLEVKFQKQRQAYSKILQHEGRLRSQIRKLDEQAAAAQLDSTHDIRAIGADVIWKAWLERTKRRLNLELAQIMVQKETMKSAVQRDYGKLMVGRALKRNLESSARKDADRANLAKWIDGHLQSARNRT